jgi:hypothetical protein
MASTGLLGFNPYSKGVAIDISSKPVNLAIQLRQRDLAKIDALDKYFMDYERSINPAGVRNVDADVFVKKLNDNKSFYLQNRDKILNPTKYGYEAQSQYMANFKDMVNLIDQSKQAAANEKVVNERIFNAVQQGKSLHDGILPLLDRQKLSVVDPKYTVFDANQLQFDKPYSEKEFTTNVLGGLKFPEKETFIPEIVNGKPTKLKIKQTEAYLSDPIKKSIESAALNEYVSNPGTKKHFDDLMKNPKIVNAVTDKYKEVYKKDLSSPEEFVVGYALLQAPIGIIKTEIPKEYLTWSEKNAITNAQENQRAAKAAKGQGGGQGGGGNASNLFDNIPDLKLTDGHLIKNGQAFDKNGNPFNGKVTLKKEYLPSEIFSVLGSDAKGVKDFEITFENGTPVKFLNRKTGVITRQGMFNYQLKYNTEPAKGQQLNFGNPNKGNKKKAY